MDVHQLRCFLAVARELHFGRAAGQLHLTPSPVSRAVRDLERELGCALFTRGHHRVELTSAGAVLAERGRAVLQAFDALPADVRRATGVAPVRVGGPYLAPPAVLDDVVACIGRALPGRVVQVEVDTSARLLVALHRGQLDVVLAHLPVLDGALRCRPLASYQLRLAMRADDVLACRAVLDWSDLQDRTIALIDPGPQPTTLGLLKQQLVEHGVTRLHQLPTADALRVAEHVRHTGEMAVTLTCASGGGARVYDDDAFAVVPLRESPDFHLGLVWRADQEDGDPIAPVLAAVAEHWVAGEQLV